MSVHKIKRKISAKVEPEKFKKFKVMLAEKDLNIQTWFTKQLDRFLQEEHDYKV